MDMRILLAGPEYEENLSIRYLSSALRAAGHDTVIAAFNEREDIPAMVAAADGAAIAGLSLCFQSRAREFFELARALKAAHPEVLVVVGGHYASCAAEDILAHQPAIDLIVIHEGEGTLCELAGLSDRSPAHLAAIRGIVFRDGGRIVFTPPRPMIEELDRLPAPDRSGPVRLLAGVPTSYLMGSRGCLGACDYCCITTLHRLVPGRRFRQRDPDRIADEMAELYHRRGTRQFIFHDDNFLVPSPDKNHARIDALKRGLDRRGVGEIALLIKCRPADVRPDVFARLKEMGLLRVFLGIESGSAAGLASLGRRQAVDDEEAAIRICNELGISVQYTIMTFHPEATPETIRADIAFMRRHIDNPLNFCRAEIYAGPPLERRTRTPEIPSPRGRACTPDCAFGTGIQTGVLCSTGTNPSLAMPAARLVMACSQMPMLNMRSGNCWNALRKPNTPMSPSKRTSRSSFAMRSSTVRTNCLLMQVLGGWFPAPGRTGRGDARRDCFPFVCSHGP